MAKLTCRSAFISDVHLGTPDCKAAYLLDFLRQVDCERLYLVGDIVDLEALAKRHWWHPDHSAVIAELFAISLIRNKYMDTPFVSAALQVVVGGALVFAAGILIGSF